MSIDKKSKENSVLVINNSETIYNKTLEMIWNPKKDITTYELALCVPYFNRRVMSFEVDTSDTHFRHFNIIDHSND